jgi:hypothetical protein
VRPPLARPSDACGPHWRDPLTRAAPTGATAAARGAGKGADGTEINFSRWLLATHSTDGASLLVAAAGAGCAPLVRVLLNLDSDGAAVAARARGGLSAMHLAAEATSREVPQAVPTYTRPPIFRPSRPAAR